MQLIKLATAQCRAHNWNRENTSWHQTFKKTSLWSRVKIGHCVMEASAHAPIQRNSIYIQTFSRYIYRTRRLEHPHPPILRNQECPKGSHSTDPLYGILPLSWTRYIYFYVYGLASLPPLRLPRAHHRVMSLPIAGYDLLSQAPSSTLAVSLVTFSNQFDPRFSIWLDSSVYYLIKLNFFLFD